MILHVFASRITCGKPRPLLCGETHWSAPEDLASLAFSKVDRLAVSLSGMPWRNP
jgi:hypothetical protein